MSYKILKIWQIAKKLSVDVLKMTCSYQNLSCMKPVVKLL